MRIVIMGVAGSGKTTVGRALARRLGVPFVDADDLHPAANVAKMAAGHALDDEDRRPWLDTVAETLAAAADIVVACSALKSAHRDLLRRSGPLRFVYLRIPPDIAGDRVTTRRGHFMGPDMVDGQFAALDEPRASESDVTSIDAAGDVADLVVDIAAALSPAGPGPRSSHPGS